MDFLLLYDVFLFTIIYAVFILSSYPNTYDIRHMAVFTLSHPNRARPSQRARPHKHLMPCYLNSRLMHFYLFIDSTAQKAYTKTHREVAYVSEISWRALNHIFQLLKNSTLKLLPQQHSIRYMTCLLLQSLFHSQLGLDIQTQQDVCICLHLSKLSYHLYSPSSCK